MRSHHNGLPSDCIVFARRDVIEDMWCDRPSFRKPPFDTLEEASRDREFVKEEATISHYVEFVPGKVAMEEKAPKKMAIVKDIMKDIGMRK